MMLPRSTMATESQVRSTSSRRWDDSTTVRPSATIERIMSRISAIPAGSSPFIGSSSRSSWGSPSRHAATPSRWRIPIEYSETRLSAAMGQADALQRWPDAVPRGLFTCRSEKPQVLPAREMAVEPGLVDDGADTSQRRVAMPQHGVSEQGHRAGISTGQPQQDPDEGGLAGAVGAEVAERRSPGTRSQRRSRRFSPRSAW